jgi:hypothetical protein
MSKSKYPNKLDTSVEIPVIRDNITEIGSDVLNSFRSAIFQIEQTLGINPQGSAGGTVAARISNALDGEGNIKKSALDMANILSGPVTDSDVSKVAAISESKLRLDFPTQVLEDQIAIIDFRIDNFIKALEELSAILSAHVHPDATNRHYAQAVFVKDSATVASAAASISLQAGTLQEVLEKIYNSHINYTGDNISETNNSHSAGQVFYDKTSTSDVIFSDSVQGAIEDLVEIESKGIRNANLNFNSNGIIRTGSVYDANEDTSGGSTIIPDASINYTGPTEKSTEEIIFITPQEDPHGVRRYDVLTLSGSRRLEDDKEYIIADIKKDSSGKIESITVFGGPTADSQTGVTATVTRNIYRPYNENALNCCVRPRYLKTNTPDVFVANPDAATAISYGVRPSEITASVNMLAIDIDGNEVEIDVYDSVLAHTGEQTINSIVNMINSAAVDGRLGIMAYKVRSLGCFEVAIAHVLPNQSGGENRTITIKEAAANDCSEQIGLQYLIDTEIEGTTGNSRHINGMLLSGFGGIIELNSESISLSTGTSNVDLASEDESFYEMGVCAGDLAVIDNAIDSSDNGTYRIKNVFSDSIALDHSDYTFVDSLDEDSSFTIVRASAPVGEMEFDEVGSNGSILFDVFTTEYGDVFYGKRMVIEGAASESKFEAVIIDVSKGFIVEGEVATIDFTDGPIYATLTDPNLNVSDPVFVGGPGRYKIMSADGMSFVVIEVWTSGSAELTAPVSMELTGFAEPASSVLHLCRGAYSTNLGMVLGHRSSSAHTSSGLSEDIGVPALIDKRSTGTVDHTIIGESVLERYIQGPRNELRGCGIIRGMELELVTDNGDGTFSVKVNPGVAVVNGIRHEFFGVKDLILEYSVSFYVAFSAEGCLVTGIETNDLSPFSSLPVAHIAKYSNPGILDLRLFIDHMDYKAIGDITVANDQRFGHFTDIKAAVDYSREFSKMFPEMSAPSVLIKEGTFYISKMIELDFDLKLSGSGPGTILKRADDYPMAGSTPYSVMNVIFKIGYHTNNDDISRGVTLCNFSYLGQDGTTIGTGDTVILTCHNSNVTGIGHKHMIKIENINFIAPATYVVSTAYASSVPNEMPIRIGALDGGLYQSIHITGCLFSGMGSMKGSVYLDPGNDYKNLNVIGNISRKTLNMTYGIIDDNRLLTSDSISGVQEVGNVIEYV